MTIEEKITHLETVLKEASKVTFVLGVQHRMAAEQELAIEEELAKWQYQQRSHPTS